MYEIDEDGQNVYLGFDVRDDRTLAQLVNVLAEVNPNAQELIQPLDLFSTGRVRIDLQTGVGYVELPTKNFTPETPEQPYDTSGELGLHLAVEALKKMAAQAKPSPFHFSPAGDFIDA